MDKKKNKQVEGKPFSIVFYNTENFYDTMDDPKTMDSEFTPTGRWKWTEKRFEDKLDKFAQVMKDIVAPRSPDVIGLAEIENRFVVDTIIKHLSEQGVGTYQCVHYESPDERGVDVAFLYKPSAFTVIGSEPILVTLPGIEDRTRDILHVVGETTTGVKLHFYVNHFPSRAEGREKSERRRYFVASELRNEITNLVMENPQEKIIVMGDFNDTPDDDSIKDVLLVRTSFNNPVQHRLYNLLYPRHKRGLGTTFHKKWLMFDQFFVTGALLTADNVDCQPSYADVFNPPYLLHTSKGEAPQPNRTYRGRYTGGYSDHLPIYLTIGLK